MMREEFENLTGLTISLHYYESLIEPEYIETNIDKQEFCAQWLKSHKSAICKALDVDMSRMMREDAVRVFKVAEHDRISKLLKERTQE